MEKIEGLYQQTLDMLPQIGIALAVLLLTIFMSMVVRRIVTKRIKPRTKNQLLADFIGKIIALAINIIGVVIFLDIIGLGNIAGHVLAGAGILTFVLGFAFKDIGENFLSGILLAFKSPFGIKDLIESDKIIGYVTEINLRETGIKSTDGKDIYIPNSQILKNPLVNYTVDGFLRYDFIVGLDYNSDITKAIEIIKQCLSEIDEVLTSKPPVVVIEELLASTINVRTYYWINTFDSKSKSYHNEIRSKVINSVLLALVGKGYYLPADIIELKNYNQSKISLNK